MFVYIIWKMMFKHKKLDSDLCLVSIVQVTMGHRLIEIGRFRCKVP